MFFKNDQNLNSLIKRKEQEKYDGLEHIALAPA